MKTSAKRISTTSVLVALILIASFLAALLPQAISPQPAQATQEAFNSTPAGGIWTVPAGVTSVTVLVVAGGGGGGGSGTIYYQGGGGGAGGLIYNASYSVTPGTNVSVTVGGSGSGGSGNNVGGTGGNSSFGTLIASGGGGGGGGDCISGHCNGDNGGSGGGGSAATSAKGTGGTGTLGQGKNGGNGFQNGLAGDNAAGGGGGNTSAGANATQDNGGNGGTGGNYSAIFGTGVGVSGWFAGGGGGGAYTTAGTGGTGGGGNGGRRGVGTAGTANTGGGGGGGSASGGSTYAGGAGGSGVVIIKYTANSAPTITSVTLQQSDKATGTSAMAPQTAYNVEIVAGDADTINDINQIDIWIFRDDDAGDNGAPAGAWDADHEAIYRWAKSGSTWSMQNGSATTTWSITTGSCDTPGDMGATSGEWNLYFTVGKLAQEADASSAEWDIKVTVTDSVSNTVSSTIYSKSMGAYSSLSLSSSSISFGSIALGGTAAIQTPVSHYITLVAIANDTFALASSSSSPWTSGGNNATLDTDGSPGAASFSLTQDNEGDVSGHPTTPQYVTTGSVTITGLGSVTRTSTAQGANEGTTDTNMYMDCILGASGLIVATYSGTITFTITNN